MGLPPVLIHFRLGFSINHPAIRVSPKKAQGPDASARILGRSLAYGPVVPWRDDFSKPSGTGT